ncbi:MAG TPA: hypothetical protein VD908_13890 [Cytophagales bacterium]|nr:hypothetical protein [Cytophagales bacterium]
MDHQITITQEDFAHFNKILKVIYNDLNYLLLRHKVVYIKVKDDGRIYFNLNNTSFVLTESDTSLRTIFNFYFYCQKHAHKFRDAAFNDKLDGTDWYNEYKRLLDAIKELELKEKPQQKMFPR